MKHNSYMFNRQPVCFFRVQYKTDDYAEGTTAPLQGVVVPFGIF